MVKYRVIKKATHPPHLSLPCKKVNIPFACFHAECLRVLGIRFFVVILEVLTIGKLEHQLNDEIRDK